MSRQVSPPTYTCDVCGIAIPGEPFSFMVSGAITGGFGPSFPCPVEQHYGCCTDHAAQAAATCVSTHMVPHLVALGAPTKPPV